MTSNSLFQDIKKAVLEQRSCAETLFTDLASGSTSHPGIMRDTYGNGENFAHRYMRDYAAQNGLAVSVDAANNTYMTWEGSHKDQPMILMGSHLDSVPHGGNFDGLAGVVAGLITTFALRSLGLKPIKNVVTMGVRAEESVWFQVSYIGSRSALGLLTSNAFEAKRIDTGRSLASHMFDCGADPERIKNDPPYLTKSNVEVFLEVHIEQAPALVELAKPIAICTGIPGNFRYAQAKIRGVHGHVGTPKPFRQDAAMAGADLAMQMDEIWNECEKKNIPIAITFGRFHTDQEAHGLTIVPGSFDFSIDVRAYDRDVLRSLEERFLDIIAKIEKMRRVKFDLGPRASADVGDVDRTIAERLKNIADMIEIPKAELGSPASHDAAAFASAHIPMCMIFVRNENGSHNPHEHMDIEDFLDACCVLACWVAEKACYGMEDHSYV